jgi:hypothetical protein
MCDEKWQRVGRFVVLQVIIGCACISAPPHSEAAANRQSDQSQPPKDHETKDEKKPKLGPRTSTPRYEIKSGGTSTMSPDTSAAKKKSKKRTGPAPPASDAKKAGGGSGASTPKTGAANPPPSGSAGTSSSSGGTTKKSSGKSQTKNSDKGDTKKKPSDNKPGHAAGQSPSGR